MIAERIKRHYNLNDEEGAYAHMDRALVEENADHIRTIMIRAGVSMWYIKKIPDYLGELIDPEYIATVFDRPEYLTRELTKEFYIFTGMHIGDIIMSTRGYIVERNRVQRSRYVSQPVLVYQETPFHSAEDHTVTRGMEAKRYTHLKTAAQIKDYLLKSGVPFSILKQLPDIIPMFDYVEQFVATIGSIQENDPRSPEDFRIPRHIAHMFYSQTGVSLLEIINHVLRYKKGRKG